LETEASSKRLFLWFVLLDITDDWETFAFADFCCIPCKFVLNFFYNGLMLKVDVIIPV
jgi:hypothetical protein